MERNYSAGMSNVAGNFSLSVHIKVFIKQLSVYQSSSEKELCVCVKEKEPQIGAVAT